MSGRRTVVSTAERLAADVRAGLHQSPPTLPARWFYDERGSKLFDEITRLPEYYPTRRETEILVQHARDIVTLTKATTLVELGSGTSAKTRLLLDAFSHRGALTFVPIDISVEVLTGAAQRTADDYPDVTVHALVADLDDPLGPLPGDPGQRLVAFLGGTIGNYTAAGRAAFFDRLRDSLDQSDHFLLGADLKKDPARLVAAYDDSAGVTAEFNRNLIDVLRRELDAEGIESSDFDHIARWNDDLGQIEMWLRARRDIHASFRLIGIEWDLPAGGEMLTEISVKFDLPVLHAELEVAGFDVAEAWTDAAGDFSLSLLVAR
ncbi:MAG TPA: L-histidine N(alpha)-methyltransferase [Mycobacteriales bacterium]|nr:L-histidine N(alpha)-methyltransferase [Mycobacteriales bacterium]